MRRVSTLLIIAIALLLIWALRPEALRHTGSEEQAASGDHAPGTLVLDLQDNSSPEQIAALERELGLDLELSSPYSADEALYRADVDDLAAAIAAARGHSQVELAEPVLQYQALGYPDDPLWEQQWNMRMVDVGPGWSAGGGRGVKVAVIDTGVSAVEDLQGVRMQAGATFVPGTSSAEDDHGHGTHVAGTIAQATNNGVGVVGVAPQVTILPFKALSAQGFGSSDWIAAAIDEAVDQGADVINMSLGGGYSAVIDKAAADAAKKGVVVVAAAGNTGREGVSCTASGEEVIGVSAVGPDEQLSYYSTWGKGVDIAAPGGDTRVEGGGILQDTIDGKGGHAYRAFQGTSMATPHVAGAAAVLIGMGLDGPATRDTLLASAQDQGEPGYDTRYGYGRLDLGAAVTRVAIHRQGLQFLVGGLVALALALLSSLRAGRSLTLIAVSSLTAGGLFFHPLLPLPPNSALLFLSRDLVSWPGLVLGPDWIHFPLWASALLPAALAFTLGPSRRLGLAVAGVCVGFGSALLYGAAAGTLDPWFLGLGLDKVWLSLNGTLALLAGMAVVGMQKLQADEANA